VALALALLVAGWILLTETGGRWALDQVPGLRVEGFEGTLAREWRAQSLVYSDGRGTRLAVEQPHLSWRPSCLFSAALCVDNLSAGRVAIALPDTGDAESPDTDAAISLPEISTPLSVEVARLEVGTITLNESLILERIAFAGAFSGPRLTIDTLNVER
jgi:translocation and assembly module TamB